MGLSRWSSGNASALPNHLLGCFSSEPLSLSPPYSFQTAFFQIAIPPFFFPRMTLLLSSFSCFLGMQHQCCSPLSPGTTVDNAEQTRFLHPKIHSLNMCEGATFMECWIVWTVFDLRQPLRESHFPLHSWSLPLRWCSGREGPGPTPCWHPGDACLRVDPSPTMHNGS